MPRLSAGERSSELRDVELSGDPPQALERGVDLGAAHPEPLGNLATRQSRCRAHPDPHRQLHLRSRVLHQGGAQGLD